MSVQPPANETVTTDEQTATNDAILERRSWNYAYVGEDTRGRHHHVDRTQNRIVVTGSEATRDDSGAVPVITIEGPILHTEELNDRALAKWIAFIGTEVCGWNDRPVSAADELQNVIAEGF